MIRGIGGIFIYSDDAQALVAWYARHLRIEFQFEESESSHYRDFVLPFDPAFGRTEREVFAIRQAPQPRTDPTRRLVVNFRVHDLTELVHHIRNCGTPVERFKDYDYGRFAWMNDPEGNLIELFEPL